MRHFLSSPRISFLPKFHFRNRNYVGDVRSFYCPSTGGSMPPSRHRAWLQEGALLDEPRLSGGCVTSLNDIQAIGGFDFKSISLGHYIGAINESRSAVFPADGPRGAWYQNTYWDWWPIWVGRAVQSDYNYRNVPCYAIKDDAAVPPSDELAVPNTKPWAMTEVGTPMFKTQKILGGRAIVSDSFSKHLMLNESPVLPGVGMYAHRDGYNVLYGDWSAKWYGDPKQKFVWWTAGSGAWTGNWDFVFWISPQSAFIGTSPSTDYDQYGTAGAFPNGAGGLNLWHELDVANGIDNF